MKQFIITIVLYVTAVITVGAVGSKDVDVSFATLTNGDVVMPSLSEMLGEEIDDFGEFDINSEIKDALVGYAKKFIGTRYRRGGKGPAGFDCSGFTSYIFRNFGYTLSPASRLQGIQGVDVDIENVEVGDLMFFSGRRGGKTVGHVGMVVDVDPEAGTCKFIHASSSQGVVIQSFPDGGYYSKRFLHARRVLSEDDEVSASVR